MTGFKILFLSTVMVVFYSISAFAGNYVLLGVNEKSSSVETLGKAPDKNKVKKKELKLGGLRTSEPQLPGGVLTLSDRMKLRAEHARQRQKAVSRARRKPQANPEPASVEDDGDDMNDDDMEPEDFQ